MTKSRPWYLSVCALALILCSRQVWPAEVWPAEAPPTAPLRGLILTSPGVFHNYEYQTTALAEGIATYANIRFDVSLAELKRWKTTDFSAGYDVLLYNICMADNQDEELIANLRRQTEVLGTPTLVIHCTMHSFRETDLWWPLYGLKTTSHEKLRPMRQDQGTGHSILAGIPADWTVAEDELYINLAFDAHTLLSTIGEDGKAHTTSWLRQQGHTPVFGTTLGHSDTTIEDPVYQRLIANAVLYVTGNLQDNGQPVPGREPAAGPGNIIEHLSSTEGAHYLDEDGRSCVLRKLGVGAAPCYLACVLNPFEWGEETAACKKACEAELPRLDELIAQCQRKTDSTGAAHTDDLPAAQ